MRLSKVTGWLQIDCWVWWLLSILIFKKKLDIVCCICFSWPFVLLALCYYIPMLCFVPSLNLEGWHHSICFLFAEALIASLLLFALVPLSPGVFLWSHKHSLSLLLPGLSLWLVVLLFCHAVGAGVSLSVFILFHLSFLCLIIGSMVYCLGASKLLLTCADNFDCSSTIFTACNPQVPSSVPQTFGSDHRLVGSQWSLTFEVLQSGV